MKFRDAVAEMHRKEAAAELARQDVTVDLAKVEAARKEYLAKLELAREGALGKMGWTLTDEHRFEIEVLKLRYEALIDALHAKQREADAEEARVLARTNTQLYGGQMWIALGILLATIVQAAIAIFNR